MADDLKDQLALSVEWERLKRAYFDALAKSNTAEIDRDNAEEALVEFEKANELNGK